jgi:hypothetical protein
MTIKWNQAGMATVAALTFVVGSVAVASPALARQRASRMHVVRPAASPPPSFGYYGEFPVELDYAQAQAWSLARPYYAHFMYDYCDYRNCRLEFRHGSWTPIWYGPPS